MKFKKALLLGIVFLASCANLRSSKSHHKKPKLYTLKEPQLISGTADSAIYQGGFSGLLFLGKTSNGEYQFMSHSDRGPNGEPTNIPGLAKNLRPFLDPGFKLRWYKIETDTRDMSFKVIEEILLTDPLGNSLSGLPQWTDSRSKFSDEQAIDLESKLLKNNLLGLDPEAITRDDEGFYWMAEEYRPSILKFNAQGRLLKRFIPKNSLSVAVLAQIRKKYGKDFLVEALPEVYKYRKTNRGFEGLTFANGRIYAIMQSSLELPQAVHKKVARLLEFNPKSEQTERQFFYPLERNKVEKLGDITSRPGTEEFYVIEQNDKIGADGVHLITSFKLTAPSLRIEPETIAFTDLKSQGQLLTPQLRLTLLDFGYDFAEKVEGLAFISSTQLAIINDDDFGTDGELNTRTQKIRMNRDKKTVLAIFEDL